METPYETEVCFVNIDEGINGDNDNIYICYLAYLGFHNSKLNGIYDLPFDLMHKLIVRPHTMDFPYYGDSYYSDNKMSIDNFDLSVKKNIKFKLFDPLSFKRSIKLNKILKNGIL